MFMTLLKHEWRSTRGILGLLCLIILSSGVAIGGSSFYMIWMMERNLQISASMQTILYLLMMAAVIAVAVCCSGAVFYLIWRFYQSRFTDEGYLTFTLPITTHQNLMSSIINTLWGCVLILLAAVAAMLIVFVMLGMVYIAEIDWVDFGVTLNDLWNAVIRVWSNSWKNLVWFGASMVSSGIAAVILLMLSVTVGSIIARKHKILAAVGVYWLISLVRNIVFAVGLVTSSSGKWLVQYPLYIGLAIIVAGYFLMYFLLDKKLNLN